MKGGKQAVTTTVVPRAPEKITLLDAVHARRQLRSLLATECSYEKLSDAKNALTTIFVDGMDKIEQSVAVNFVEGKHFKVGAKSWRDLDPSVVPFHQTLLNGFGHLYQQSKGTVPKNVAHVPVPYCKSTMVLETLLQMKDMQHRVVGYRMWILTSTSKELFADNGNKRKKGPKRAPNPRPKKKARTNDEDASGSKDEEGEEVEEEEGTATIADFAPVTMALERSFAQAEAINAAIKTKVQAWSISTAKTQGKNSRELLAKMRAIKYHTVGNTVAEGVAGFAFLNVATQDQFKEEVEKYINPGTYAVRSDEQWERGKIVDPRPFLEEMNSEDLRLHMAYTNRRHVKNPDAIFTKESAMVYYMRDNQGKSQVEPEQRKLSCYMQNLTVEKESEMLKDEEVVEDTDLLNQAQQDLICAAQADTPLYANYLKHLIDLKVPDIVQKMRFPHAQLTYVVNKDTYARDSPQHLPFPVGHILSDAEYSTGTPECNLITLATKACALGKEEVSFGKGAVAHFTAAYRDNADGVMDTRPVVLTASDSEANAMLINQRNVVKKALGERKTLWDTQPECFLIDSAPEVVYSSTSKMGDDDLPPLDLVDPSKTMKKTFDINDAVEMSESNTRLKTGQQPLHELSENERREEEARLEEMTEHATNHGVDPIPSHVTANDDILKHRQHMQTEFSINRWKMIKAQKAARKKAVRNRDLRKAFHIINRKLYSFALTGMRFIGADRILQILRESNNIPNVFMDMEFRSFLNKHCTLEGMLVLGADKPVVSVDHKPFVGFMQHTLNVLDTGNQRVKEPGTRLALQLLNTALDTQTWSLLVRLPGAHALVSGETAVGKSHIANAILQMMAPGIAKPTSIFSTSAFHTSTNWDHSLIVNEEAKADIVAPNKDDQQRGTSNAANLIKDIMTTEQSNVPRAFYNKETGKTTTETSHSSASGLRFIFLTNTGPDKIQPALLRRMTTIIHARLQGNMGHKAEHAQPLKFAMDPAGESNDAIRTRVTFAMYVVLRQMIKGGVLPLPDSSYANMIIVDVLNHLGLKYDATKLHQFIQFAENYQLYYAAHMICWSVFQALYHAFGGFPRWSGTAIVELYACFAASVSADAAILSLTTYDFLVLHPHTGSFMRTVASLLRLDEPLSQRCFRSVRNFETKTDTYDPNMFQLEAYNKMEMLRALGSNNDTYQFGQGDIEGMIAELAKTTVTGPDYAFVMRDGQVDGVKLSDDSVTIKSRTPIELNLPSRGKAHLFVSTHFVKDHFKKDVNNPAEWRDLKPTCTPIDGSTFSRADARDLAYVKSTEHGMVKSIQHVMSNSTLNKAPDQWKIMGESDKYNEFITGMTLPPLQINLSKVPVEKGSEKTVQYQTMLNGTLLMIRIPRNPNKDPIFRENLHIPPPSLKSERLARSEQKPQNRDDAMAKIEAEIEMDMYQRYQQKMQNSLGYTIGQYDGDYVFNVTSLNRMGFLGTRPFMELVLKPTEFEAFDKIKEPIPYPEPVPYGFGPMAYTLQKMICTKMGIKLGDGTHYPGDHIYKQLKDSINVETIKHLPFIELPKKLRAKITNITDELKRPITGDMLFEDEASEADVPEPKEVVDNDAMDIDEIQQPALRRLPMDTPADIAKENKKLRQMEEEERALPYGDDDGQELDYML